MIHSERVFLVISHFNFKTIPFRSTFNNAFDDDDVRNHSNNNNNCAHLRVREM